MPSLAPRRAAACAPAQPTLALSLAVLLLRLPTAAAYDESLFHSVSRGEPRRAPRRAAPVGVVQACGVDLCAEGEKWVAAGSNVFDAAQVARYSEEGVYALVKAHAGMGANALRVFAHSNGDAVAEPLQPKLGEYNEKAFRRLDILLDAAAKDDVRLILPMANFEDFTGGIAWYAAQLHGSSAPKELFYVDPQLKGYYKSYVARVINRTNSVNGRAYRDDPAVLAWELMNEPHTSDGFERARGIAPGTIMAAWVQEMAAYFQSLDGAHLVSSGEEGYRVDGKPPVSDSDWMWMNSGLKGSDFIADCNDPNVNLCTIRGYPDNWNFSEDEYLSWDDAFAADRAAVAHAAGKPVLLEEYGMSKARYRKIPSREPVLRFLQDSARALGFAGTLVWAVDHERGPDQDSGGYVFGPDGDGSKAVREQYAWARGQSGGAAATDGGGGGGGGGAAAAFASKEGGGGR